METPDTETKLKFPESFLLGAANAAHQVEGDNINSDWWYEEQRGRLPTSGLACDHYHRFDEDFGLAEQIGLNAMRISIEWARIEPEEGRWNAQAIEHYKKVLKSMKAHGLTRFVTLWHWTMPKWLYDKGGFETKLGVEAFGRYAWFVAQNLGKEVDFWITLNEPENFTAGGYIGGVKPPFKKSLVLSRRVLENLIAAHKAAYGSIKEVLGDVPVSIAKNNNYYFPFRKGNWADRFAAFVVRRIANDYFLDKIKNHLDYIGLNYYFANSIKFNPRRFYEETNLNGRLDMLTPDKMKNRSDMGWVLYPQGIYDVLMDLKKYQKPVYITENGLADAADSRRYPFIHQTLEWIQKAMAAGVDVRGYLHWTLTDNYEWQHGFGPRFGLVEMNYDTLERKIRPSARIFKELR